MLTKKQINLLKIFHDNLREELTFKQLKKESKQKSNNLIQTAINEFLKQDIIKIKKTGNVNTYKINLQNNLSKAYLELINQTKIKKTKIPHKILEVIQQKINKKTNLFILIIFGSYAKQKQKQDSDLDLAILIDTEEQRKEINPILETIKRREVLNIDYHVITTNEFKEMLSAEYENLSKQIQKNNLIIKGHTNYIDLIESLK